MLTNRSFTKYLYIMNTYRIWSMGSIYGFEYTEITRPRVAVGCRVLCALAPPPAAQHAQQPAAPAPGANIFYLNSYHVTRQF